MLSFVDAISVGFLGSGKHDMPAESSPQRKRVRAFFEYFEDNDVISVVDAS
jgi:hypothetical protein